jgi:hypothetical protein
LLSVGFEAFTYQRHVRRLFIVKVAPFLAGFRMRKHHSSAKVSRCCGRASCPDAHDSSNEVC